MQWKFTKPEQLDIEVLLIKIPLVFWPLNFVHLLQSDQRFKAIKFVDQPVPEKF